MQRPASDRWVSLRSAHPTRKTWMAGTTSPAMTKVSRNLRLRRRGPRPLRAAQAFERLGHAEHTEIVETAADDLYADRKALRVVTAIDRDRRIFRHIPRHSKSNVLERPVRIVDRSGEFGGEIHHRRDRRNHVVEVAEQFRGRGADRHRGVETSDDVDAGKLRGGFGPFVDVRQRLAALLG